MKVFGFIRKRHDFTWQAFSDYWRTTHRREALKLTKWLNRYEQDHLLPVPALGLPRPAADGCPMLWVDAPESLEELAAGEAYITGAYLDEPRFMEGRSGGLAVSETVVVTPPVPAFASHKLSLFYRGDAPSLAAPNANGRIENTALAPSEPPYDYSGVIELWWPTVQARDADTATFQLDPNRHHAAWVLTLPVISPNR
jgi:hypothetical protein